MADQGNDLAQYNLGYMYEMGMGVIPDRNEAIKWYKKAATKKNNEAIIRLLENDPDLKIF